MPAVNNQRCRYCYMPPLVCSMHGVEHIVIAPSKVARTWVLRLEQPRREYGAPHAVDDRIFERPPADEHILGASTGVAGQPLQRSRNIG